jgi:DNA-binding NarL/FixJ family response regulator
MTAILEALSYELHEAGCRPSVVVDVCANLRSPREQLVMLRRVEGWSEVEIAREIGSSQKSISRILAGPLRSVFSIMLYAEGM